MSEIITDLSRGDEEESNTPTFTLEQLVRAGVNDYMRGLSEAGYTVVPEDYLNRSGKLLWEMITNADEEGKVAVELLESAKELMDQYTMVVEEEEEEENIEEVLSSTDTADEETESADE